MTRLTDRNLADPLTEHAVRRYLEEELRIIPSRETTAMENRILEFTDGALKLPIVLDPQTVERLLGNDADMEKEDFYVEQAIEDASLGGSVPINEWEPDFKAALRLVDSMKTCEGLALNARTAADGLLEEVRDSGLPEIAAEFFEQPNRERLDMVIETTDLFGDMSASVDQKAKIGAALTAYLDEMNRAASEAWERAKKSVRADALQDQEDALQDAKEDVVNYICSHLEEFRTTEKAPPLNPVAKALAEEAGMTLQQIGDIFGVSRQAAAHYVNGQRAAPHLDEAGMGRLKAARVAMAARLAALDDVVERLS